MDVGDVRAHRPGASGSSCAGPVDVQRDRRADLAADRPVRWDRTPVARASVSSWSVAGEVLLAQAADVVRILVLRPRRARAVGVDAADPRLPQPLDRGVGMLGRVGDVRPVEERGDARVDGAPARSAGRRRTRLRADRRCARCRRCRGSSPDRAGRSGRMLRSWPCQMCRCESTKPGHDDHVRGVDHRGGGLRGCGPTAAIFEPSISTSALLEVAELWSPSSGRPRPSRGRAARARRCGGTSLGEACRSAAGQSSAAGRARHEPRGCSSPGIHGARSHPRLVRAASRQVRLGESYR